MDWLRQLLSRFAALFTRRKLDADLDEELRAHLEIATGHNLQSGLSREAARREALREFGGVTQIKERYRMQRGAPFLDHLARDVRYAVRQLARSPSFTLTAVLTLALGIGANTAMFSVVEGVLLSPLPYPDPDRIVMVWQSRPNVNQLDISYPDFLDWQRSNHSFERMAAFTFHQFNLAGRGGAEHVAGMRVSSGFFAALGVKPAVGRDFSPPEDRPGAAPAAIISTRLWKDRFASNPNILGEPVTLEGVDYAIVGVLPAGFRFWLDGDVYIPIAEDVPAILMERSVHGIGGVARLKPGVSLATAQSELDAIQRNLDRLFPAEDRGIGVDLVPMKQQMVGEVRPTLLLLLCAVGMVLLIACANVANLLLVRSSARTREFGVRTALGASRGRIVRQLLTESVFLSLAGGALGLVLAKTAISLVLSLLHDTLPRSESIRLNFPVLLFTLLISIAVAIFFGIGPALKGSRVDVLSSLKNGARGSTGASHRLQGSLVVLQMALTLVLLAASGLLLRSIYALLQINPGFDAHQLVSFQVALSPSLTRTAPEIRETFQQLLDRIRQVPGVQGAAVTNIVPLSGDDNSGPFWLGSNEPASPQDAPHALYFWTGPDYLQTMRIPLLQGRFFTLQDTAHTDRVVVIDRDLARKFFAGTNAVGQTLTVAHWGTARIVGVVGHVHHWGLDDSRSYNAGQIYIPVYQLPDKMVLDFLRESLSIVVRSPLDTASLLVGVKQVVYGSAADQVVYNVEPMEQIINSSMAAQRLPMMLLVAFAGLALALASVGIYGVISYSVAQRVQEIGIRMALGANRKNVLGMVVGRGFRLAITGLGIGLVATLALARVLGSFSRLLYGVQASDPLTLAAVSILLTAAAMLACALPARRAASIDPARALRTE